MIEIENKGVYETKRVGKKIILTYINNEYARKAYDEYSDKLFKKINIRN